jgi:GTP cyclohydrolase II
MNNLSPAYNLQPSLAAALAPRAIERVMRARGDVRLGVPVVLTDGARAVLMIAAEALTFDRFAALGCESAPAELVLTGRRATALGAAQDGDSIIVPMPKGAGLDWVIGLADPAEDSPFRLDPATLATGGKLHQAAIALAKSAQLLPAALIVALADGAGFAQANGLTCVTAPEVLAELSAARFQAPVSSAILPMAAHDVGRVHVFRPNDGGIEHYAIEVGKPDFAQPVLVRLHSACFTGDVMGSLKCDCGAQLHAACAAMAEAGGGVLLYLSQEGRGIGMANKMRAYALQDQGLDTVEANHHLGFDDDERDFRNGAAILQQLGVGAVRLLTNNPAKLAILQAQGVIVTERVALQVGKTRQNSRYLATKAAKSGHLLT